MWNGIKMKKIYKFSQTAPEPTLGFLFLFFNTWLSLCLHGFLLSITWYVGMLVLLCVCWHFHSNWAQQVESWTCSYLPTADLLYICPGTGGEHYKWLSKVGVHTVNEFICSLVFLECLLKWSSALGSLMMFLDGFYWESVLLWDVDWQLLCLFL